MESAAEESASGDLGVERLDPAPTLIAGDRARLGRYLRRPLGENRMETPGLALEGHERPHPHVCKAQTCKQARELAGEPAVDRSVVGVGYHDPACQLAVRVGDNNGVAVEVKNSDPATRPDDTDHLAQGTLSTGHVGENSCRDYGVEGCVGVREIAAVTFLEFDQSSDPGCVGVLAG